MRLKILNIYKNLAKQMSSNKIQKGDSYNHIRETRNEE